MKPIELFVLFGSGYVCGLSIGSGFVLQAIKKLFVSRWSNLREALWVATSGFHAILCGWMAVMFVGLVVVSDQPHRADFWYRMVVYAIGVGGGMAFVFVCVHLVNTGMRVHRASLPETLSTSAPGRSRT